MKGLFNAAINQPLNTAVDSATITLSGVGSKVPLTLISGSGTSAYKNGASVSSTTVSDGDKIRIRVLSSTAYATPKFGVIKIGNEQITFSVATINDPTITFNAAADNVLPIDLTKYVDGSAYVPTFSGNELSLYSASGLLSRSLALNAPARNSAKATDAMMIADYHRDSMYVFDSLFNLIASFSTGAGSKPYGLAVTKTSATDDVALTWVTLSGKDQVVAYDYNYVAKFTFNTGSRPLGIASSPDGNHVYVANYNSNNVTHFNYTSGSWVATTIAVGLKPSEVAVDANGNAWVTCAGDDNIYKITTADAVTNYATAQQGHRGLAFDKNGILWIAAAESKAVVRMDSTGTVVSTIANVGNYPYAVASNEDGSIINVSCFDDATVSSYNADGTFIRNFAVDKCPYGLAAYAGYILVASMYPNTPPYNTPKDQSVLQFSIADPAIIKRSTAYTSNTVTVSGLSAPVPIVIPADMWGAVILKNGVAVNTASTVQNGDTVAIRFTSPSTYGTDVEIPIMVGNFYESFVSRTEVEKTVPDAFAFKSVINADLNSKYTSNAITISGLSTATIVPFTVDSGVIVLNGVEQATQTVNVKNGDKVALAFTSSLVENTPLRVKATAGSSGMQDDGSTVPPFSASWSITTKNSTLANLWLKPEYLNQDEYVPIQKNAVATANKQIVRIRNKALESLSINDTLVPLDTKNLLIPSVYDGAVYEFNGQSFDTYISPNGIPLIDVIAGRFAITANRMLDYSTGESYDIPLYSGRRLAYSEALDTLYISFSGGLVGCYTKSNGGGHFKNAPVTVGGSPHAMAIDSANALWVADRVSGTITRIVAGYIATRVVAGAGIYDMAIARNFLWTANSYDNTISKIDLTTKVVTTFKVDGSPWQIEADVDGSVWVTMPAKKTVQNIDANGNKISELALSTASTFMTSFAGDIYLAESYPGLVEAQNKYTTLTPLVLNFGSTEDEARSSHVLSPKLKVSGLIRPTDAYIQPNSGYDLYVNGALVPTGKATLKNDDIVYLDVLTPNLYYSQTVATLNDTQSINEFSVRTESNAKPDFLAFLDIYNGVPRVNVTTEAIKITGLIDGQPVLISTKDEQWMIVINGGAPVTSAHVQNGDSIQLVGPPHQSYNTQRSYLLNLGKHGDVCGSVTVHTVDLSGGIYYAKGIPTFSKPALYASKTRQDFKAFNLSGVSKWRNNMRAIRTATGSLFERADRNARVTNNSRVFTPMRSGSSSVREFGGITFVKSSLPEQKSAPRNDFQKLFGTRLLVSGAVPFTKGVSPKTFSPADVTPFIKSATSEKTLADVVQFMKGVAKADVRSDVVKFTKSEVSHNQSSANPQFIPAERSSYSVAITTFEKRRRSITGTVSKDFVISKQGAQLTVSTPFVRNDVHTATPITPQWELKQTTLPRPVERNPFVRFDSHKVLVPVKELTPFVRMLPIRTAPMPTGLKSESNTNVSGINTMQRNTRAKQVVMLDLYVKQNTPTQILIDRVFERRTNSVSVHSMPTALRNAHDAKLISLPTFIRNARSHKSVALNYSMYEYVVHDYTIVEPQNVRGGFANANDAVAAGVAAGYSNAYAVQVQDDCYVWAAPVDSGDFCGVVPPASKFAQPYRWHMQGG